MTDGRTDGGERRADGGGAWFYFAPLVSALFQPRVEMSVSFEPVSPLKEDICTNVAVINVFVFIIIIEEVG